MPLLGLLRGCRLTSHTPEKYRPACMAANQKARGLYDPRAQKVLRQIASSDEKHGLVLRKLE